MVGENAAMGRRSNLPARIVQGRHVQKAKQLLWETIAADDRHKMPPREQQIVRTIKKHANKQKENRDTIWRRRKKQDRERRKETRRKKNKNKKMAHIIGKEYENRTANVAQPQTT